MNKLNSESKIFEGFQALGLHSSDLPHVFKYNQIRNEYLLYSAVGKVFHTYLCPKLLLHRVSNQHPAEIECIAADDLYVYTSCQNVVYADDGFKCFKFKYVGHNHPVHIILPFGKHLITVDKESNVILWHIESETLYLAMEFSNSTFEISAALHPITYVNKILFASKQGTMQLWNVSKNKMIYDYKNLKDSPITVLEQAPAIDVVGIGNESGDIVMLNLKLNMVIMQLNQEGGEITALSFRTDGETVMAAGSAVGHIFLWDLDDRKVIGLVENAHSCPIANVTYVHNHSLLISNSADNSLKVWEFEKGAGIGTLMHSVFGHLGGLTKIRYYKDDLILTAGSDSTLKVFSTYSSVTKNLGQASFRRKQARSRSIKQDEDKLPPVVDFAVETARESVWDGLIAAHYRHPVATTWNLQCSRMGTHKFFYKEEELRYYESKVADCGLFVSCVAATSCGNFCLIGYSSGSVEIYNMQSGLHRGSYLDKSLNDKAHCSTIVAIAVDALNQITITVGAEKKLKFWRFKRKTLLQVIELQTQPSFAALHKTSSLLAIAFDDFTFTLIDIETRKIVRHFNGHTGKINDLSWSEDARWIVTAGMDCCVKTWDIPSVALIDCFSIDNAAISVTFSPSSDFLATAHVDDPGIYLWSNRTLYGYVNLSPLPYDYHPDNVIELPATIAPHENEEVDAEDRDVDGNVSNLDRKEKEQLADNLITLSSIAYAKWANVLQLDTIRKRNKPKEPPKAPKNAPFFLPTIASLVPEFLIEKKDEESRLKTVDPNQHFSEFGKTLLNANGNYEAFMVLLKSMSLLNIDSEIKSLSPDGGGSIALLYAFLDFIEQSIDSKRDFEIVQAYFSLFLNVHADTLFRIDNIESILSRIDVKLNKDRIELSRLLNQNQCIVHFIKSATV